MTIDRSGQIALFWDYDTCGLPSRTSALLIINRILEAAREHGGLSSLRAYLDVTNLTSEARPALADLEGAGICLHHCTEGSERAMMIDTMTYAMDWPNATLMIITKNPGLSQVVAKLSMRNRNIIMVTPRSSSNILKLYAKVLLDWEDPRLQSFTAENLMDTNSNSNLPPGPTAPLQNGTPAFFRTPIRSPAVSLEQAPSPAPVTNGLLTASSSSAMTYKTALLSDSRSPERPTIVSDAFSPVVNGHHIPAKSGIPIDDDEHAHQATSNVLVVEDDSETFWQPSLTPRAGPSSLSTVSSRQRTASPEQHNEPNGTSTFNPWLQVLTDVLFDLRAQYKDRPLWSEVATQLKAQDRHIYRNAGVSRLKEFIEMAEDADLVECGNDGNGGDWMRLRPHVIDFRVPPFEPLTEVLSDFAREGNQAPLGSALAAVLLKRDPHAYERAGVGRLKDYLELARESGVVKVFPLQNGDREVRLNAL